MSKNETALVPSPSNRPNAGNTDADGILRNAGFHACVAESRPNGFERHNAEEANKRAKARILASARHLVES